jgi:hypothetical protein
VADAARVRLWDVAARRELPALTGHGGAVTSVAFTPDGKALVSASEDCTALIWDVDGLLPPLRGAAQVKWSDLNNDDRLQAYVAFCRLRASPDDAVRLLRANLQPSAAVPPERLADLIKKLDDESFEVRKQATKELSDLGPSAEKALREAARHEPSLEAARRIDQLLADLDTGPDWRRTLAALRLLEELPPATGRELLEPLAAGYPDSRLTREARAALQRVLQRDREPKP